MCVTLLHSESTLQDPYFDSAGRHFDGQLLYFPLETTEFLQWLLVAQLTFLCHCIHVYNYYGYHLCILDIQK